MSHAAVQDATPQHGANLVTESSEAYAQKALAASQMVIRL